MQRAIIHLDMDAFYASVEQLDFPELAGKPVIVGGSRERGVVCACSYEARSYGVHSALAMAKALQRCPAAVVRPVRMDRYRVLSQQIFAIFGEFTDLVEPLSIDEAFLDVTGCRRLFGEPVTVARRIISRVKEGTGLTVSAGVAPNKFLAKLASSRCKPAGLWQIRPDQIDEVLEPLPVEVLWGVGRKIAQELAALGIRTIAELRRLDRAVLVQRFGQIGGQLYELCRGIDERPVVPVSAAISMGAEETFPIDLTERSAMDRELLRLATTVARRVRAKRTRGRRLTLKLKYADFTQQTRSRTLEEGIDTTGRVFRLARELLEQLWDGRRAVRLLGLYLGEFGAAGEGQVTLFGDENERERALDAAVDRLKRKYAGLDLERATVLEKEASGEDGKDPR